MRREVEGRPLLRKFRAVWDYKIEGQPTPESEYLSIFLLWNLAVSRPSRVRLLYLYYHHRGRAG